MSHPLADLARENPEYYDKCKNDRSDSTNTAYLNSVEVDLLFNILRAATFETTDSSVEEYAIDSLINKLQVADRIIL